MLVAALAEVQARGRDARGRARGRGRAGFSARPVRSAPRETPFAFSETRRASRSRTRRVARWVLYERRACGSSGRRVSETSLAARSTRRRRGPRRTNGIRRETRRDETRGARGRAGRGWADGAVRGVRRGARGGRLRVTRRGRVYRLDVRPERSVAAARSRRVRPGGGGAGALREDARRPRATPRPARTRGRAPLAVAAAAGAAAAAEARCWRRAPIPTGLGDVAPRRDSKRDARGDATFSGSDAAFESSPILAAARNGDYRLVQLLASRGADARAAEALGAPTVPTARAFGSARAARWWPRGPGRGGPVPPLRPRHRGHRGRGRRRRARVPRGGGGGAGGATAAAEWTVGVSFRCHDASRRRRDARRLEHPRGTVCSPRASTGVCACGRCRRRRRRRLSPSSATRR